MKLRQDEFPKIFGVICHNFYFNNLLTGTNSFDEILHIKQNLSKKLEQHGLKLQEWVSNSPDIQKQEDFILTIGHND